MKKLLLIIAFLAASTNVFAYVASCARVSSSAHESFSSHATSSVHETESYHPIYAPRVVMINGHEQTVNKCVENCHDDTALISAALLVAFLIILILVMVMP